MIHQFCTDSFNFFLDAFIMSWLGVNENGERYASEMNFEPYVTNARMAQPHNRAWSIFDSNCREHIKTQWRTKSDEWISSIEGGNQIDAALESGYMVQADTIEELAEKIDCDPQTLTDTLASYNDCCAAYDVSVCMGSQQGWAVHCGKRAAEVAARYLGVQA